jgi:biofilm PGA synthesis protein PgaD
VAKIIYIDAPEALTRRQRTVGALITAVMWAAYAYLWLPLVSLFAWGLGFELAYDAMVRAGGAGALRSALFWYGVVLADVIATVALWSLINRWRFADHNRRTAHPRVADTAMADHFGVTIGAVEQLRGARRVELDIDALGRPVVHAADLGAGLRPAERRARRANTR